MTRTDSVILDLDDSRIVIPKDRRLRKVYLEFSSRCNLSCPMCFRESWTEPQGDMDWALMLKLVSCLHEFPDLETVHFLGIGEPFCNPLLFEAVRVLKSARLRVRITTNATMLDAAAAEALVAAGVDVVDLSVEAENVPWPGRANSMETLVSAADELFRAKKKKCSTLPDTRIALVVTRSNLSRIPDIIHALRGKGINAASVSNLLPTDIKADANRLYPVSLEEEASIRSKLYTQIQHAGIRPELPRFALSTERHCAFVRSESCFTRWDGLISPCLRLSHGYREVVLGREKEVVPWFFGDIKRQTLAEIWDDPGYVSFRWRLRRALYASCLDCNLLRSCEYAKTTESDCWGDSPGCSDCLWDRNLIRCP
ncbi:MAG: radical SAM protein [Thermovirgaceae bacterium]|nr:radical SAM protein [Thermovirgaceae bacterium]